MQTNNPPKKKNGKRARRVFRHRATEAALAAISLGLPVGALSAATYEAGNAAQLAAAINSVNAGAGDDTISLTGTVTLGSALPQLTRSVVVEGNGTR